ncbi:glycine-rich domain-containing protein [Haloferula chungangensis]|uniref:Glycine-rich domain-containing protein n=1 Tax=Haloferula chungangensis TaxID=1048331 RepID=A0ABW2L5B0_9BACT
MKDSLLHDLENFEVDRSGIALPFAKRLARENGWREEFSERVMKEYFRFVFLAMRAGHPVTPSEQVDQAWHLHLCYTRSYWDRMCRELLGRPLHHGPTEGGEQEGKKFEDWYERTLESYRRIIGEDPPGDIWPSVKERFASAGAGRWVNPSDYWLVRKPSAKRAGTLACVGLLSVATAGCAGMMVAKVSVGEGFFLILFAVVVLVAIIYAISRIGGGGGGGCGGGSGGGWGWFGSGDSGCSSGGDSGCGGGGCGGGCGS